MASALDNYKQPPGTNPKSNQPIMGSDNLVYKNISAHQSRITNSLFVPVKTSRIRSKGASNQHDDSESIIGTGENNNTKMTLHDQIKLMNKIPDGVWTPSMDESMSSLPFNRKSPDLIKQQSLISGDSPGRKTPNTYQLRLKMIQPQISPHFKLNGINSTPLEIAEDQKIAPPNFNESIRSSTQWLKEAANIDIKNYHDSLNNTTMVNWQSKLPLINIQIDTSKSTINYQNPAGAQTSLNQSIKEGGGGIGRQSQLSGSPDYIGVNDLTVKVTIQGKMFPKRYLGNMKKLMQQQYDRNLNNNSSSMQYRGGMIELRSPFTPPDAVRNHPKPLPAQIRIMSRQRESKDVGCGTGASTQYGPSGFKNMLQGGGYQRQSSKVSDENSKASVKDDNMKNNDQTTPNFINLNRKPINNAVLDAKHLGFTLPNHIDDLTQAFSPSLFPLTVKASPVTKNLRKKQLQAYHGWLKSKAQKAQSVLGNQSRISDQSQSKTNHVGEINLIDDLMSADIGDDKFNRAFLSPQPHGPSKILEEVSAIKTVLFPIHPPPPAKAQSTKRTVINKQTHVIPVIPDLSRFLNNESLATIDRDLINQHPSFINANNPHFENSHRSLKGLFRKTSKTSPFSNQASPRGQVKNLAPIQQSSSFDQDETIKATKEKVVQSQLAKYVQFDNKIGIHELRRLSQNIQKASEFLFQGDEQVVGSPTPIMLPNRPAFAIGVTSQLAHSPYERSSKNQFRAGAGFLLREAAASVMSQTSNNPIQVPTLPLLNGSHTALQVKNLQQVQSPQGQDLLNRTTFSDNSQYHINGPQMREENMADLVTRIREQKNKKRRGKFNKNEALYEFIEQIHQQQLAEKSIPSEESPRLQLNTNQRQLVQRNSPLDIMNIRGSPTRLLQLFGSSHHQTNQ